MSQTTVTNLDKAAVLLSRLDPRALDKVLEMLGPDFAGRLRTAVAAVSRRTDFGQLCDAVWQEFLEVQQEVRAATSASPAHAPKSSQDQPPPAAGEKESQRGTNVEAAAAPDTSSVAATSHQSLAAPAARSDVEGADSLASLPPAVLAAALKPESPRMIATVLKHLPADFAGKVLEVLPPDLRQTAFLLMADPAQVNVDLVRRVMDRLLDVCRKIDPVGVEQQDRRLKTLIGVLQTVEREERIRLLESLTERDPDLASQIENLMYDYLDIQRIEDRSVQKLLGQLEQRVVATALKSAPEGLRQKVFKNLSERVRLALNEEMELLSGLTASKVDQARHEIANVIRSMDKDGSLVWIE